ncbi:retrovirus-related pol polyprotein from transposon TNT 1-94 [Tanacetum coccineum]|uniref:Retrovirus-related pol polyprotein from transposon TNT 1-94 n=1 Tax=Tanacetum coccineum TaxID=301880 RepID=A0ABQ5A1H2_9ASTR
MSPFTGVSSSTEASGSKPSLNANSELICATCHECMFDVIHGLCVSDYLNDVNSRVKSKYVKSRNAKSKKKNLWKHTGKVNTNVRYRWKPTRRIFTIDGNTCHLTRIISNQVVPPRKSISTTLVKQTQTSSNKSRKLKDIKNVGSSSQSKTIGSKISNHSEPMQNWGSNVSTALSSSRVNFRLYKLYSSTWTQLAKQGLVRGLPKLKFEKDRLCSACSLGKSKKSSYKPKADDIIQAKLYLLHMDLCGPMRVKSINGKKYILVIIDNYSRFTWVKAEAVSTSCYTQNCSLIRLRYNKTPYELMHEKKPNLSLLHVFGSLCYPINDSEDLGKLKPKADIGIFVGYAPTKKAFQIYNKRT